MGGLSPEVAVANWNPTPRLKPSLKFFSDRGHRQVIATYYDHRNWRQTSRRMLDLAKEVKGVDGVMYTTWRNNFRDLEDFMDFATDP